MRRTSDFLVLGASLVAFLLAASPAGAGGAPAQFVTPFDTIPNFAFTPTLRSAQSGPWSAAATWTPARLPLPTDVVLVEHTVTYDSLAGVADVVGIDAGGTLRFSTAQSTRLATGVLLVMPGGALEVGTPAAPLPGSLTAEIVIRNRPLVPATDPDQFGTGMISVNGHVTLHGSPRSPTFVRLAAVPGVGATSLVSSQAVTGWRVGDRLMVPDSAQPLTETSGVPRSYDQEELTLASVSGDGLTLGISPALAFAHPGTTDEDADGQPDYLPHVANLERNVVVRSESRTGTRGHVFLTYRSTIDVRYAAFLDLGRTTFEDLDPVTNHIGRYAVHLHHLMGPYPPTDPVHQFRLVGNVVRENAATTPPQKWGIAIHDSHWGLLRDNVIYNIGGAAFVTEDGSESFNLFDHNFAARVLGNGGRNETDEEGRGVAREGVGFWFRGPNNRVTRNVAVNMIEGEGEIEAAYGFKYNFTYLGEVRIPNFRGADTSIDDQVTVRQGNGMGLLEFADNETYGQIQGFTLWWLCTLDFTPVAGCPASVVSDLVVWHTARYAYYGYPGFNYTFERRQGLRRPGHCRRQQLRVQEHLFLRRLRHHRPARHPLRVLQHDRPESALLPRRLDPRRGLVLQDAGRNHPQKERRRGELPDLRPARSGHGGGQQHLRARRLAPAAHDQPERRLDRPRERRPPLRLRPRRPAGRPLRGLLPLAGQRPLHEHPAGRGGLRLHHPRSRPRLHPPLRRRLRIRRQHRAGRPRPPERAHQ